jgi:hypothetical protein
LIDCFYYSAVLFKSLWCSNHMLRIGQHRKWFRGDDNYCRSH